MSDRLREAIRTIVALVDDVSVRGYWSGMTTEQDLVITALRAALAEPERKRRTVKKRLTDDGWKKTREYCS